MIQNYPFPIQSKHNGLQATEFMSCEIEFLTLIGWLSKARKYKDFLEIGRYKGQTTWYLNELARDADGWVTSVDVVPLDGPPHSREKFVQGKSQEWLRASNDLFDFILIDGDHSTQGCMEDFTQAILHLNKWGTIAIHDTVFLPEVTEAVKKLKETWCGGWMDLPIGKGMSFYQPRE